MASRINVEFSVKLSRRGERWAGGRQTKLKEAGFAGGGGGAAGGMGNFRHGQDGRRGTRLGGEHASRRSRNETRGTLTMDTDRFDRLTRSLTTSRSRRGALTALLGGTLGLLGRAETDARKRKGKGKGKKKNKGGNRPTCGDGARNGSETDVDCGGTCPRCQNGKICDNRNDCESASCSVFGYCFACGEDSHCPNDSSGACVCRQPASGGGAKTCTKATACDPSCPDRSVCVENGGFFYDCYERCGAP